MEGHETQIGRKTTAEREVKVLEDKRSEVIQAAREGTDPESALLRDAFVNSILEPNVGRTSKGYILYEMSGLYHDAQKSLEEANNPAEIQKAHVSLQVLYKQARLDAYSLEIPEGLSERERMQLMAEQLQQDLDNFPGRAVEEHFMANYFDAKAKSNIANEKLRELVDEKDTAELSRSEIRRESYKAERVQGRLTIEQDQLLAMVGTGTLRAELAQARQDRVTIPIESIPNVTVTDLEDQIPQFSKLPPDKKNELMQGIGATFDRMVALETRLGSVIDIGDSELICTTFQHLKETQARWQVHLQEVDLVVAQQNAMDSVNNVRTSLQEARQTIAEAVRGNAQLSDVRAKAGEVATALAQTLENNTTAIAKEAKLALRPFFDRPEIAGIRDRIDQLRQKIDTVVIAKVEEIALKGRRGLAQAVEETQMLYTSNAVEFVKIRIEIEYDAKQKLHDLNVKRLQLIQSTREKIANRIEGRSSTSDSDIEDTMLPIRTMTGGAAILARNLIDHQEASQTDLSSDDLAELLIERFDAKEPADLLPWLQAQHAALIEAYNHSLGGKNDLSEEDALYLKQIQDRLNAGIMAFEELQEGNNSLPEALQGYKTNAESILILISDIAKDKKINAAQHSLYRDRVWGMQRRYNEINNRAPAEEEKDEATELVDRLRNVADVEEAADIMAEPQELLREAFIDYFDITIPLNERENTSQEAIRTAEIYLNAWDNLPQDVRDRLLLNHQNVAEPFLINQRRLREMRALTQRMVATKGKNTEQILRDMGEIYREK